MTRYIVKYRTLIIVVSVLVTLGFSAVLFRLEVDPDLKNYFPDSMASVHNTEKIEEVFGSQDLVMVIFETDDVLEGGTLKRIKSAEKAFRDIDGITRTTSMFGSNRIYGEGGIMYVEPTVLRIPRNPEEKEKLREIIRNNDLVYKIMVSDDFRAASIVLTLDEKADEDAVFAGIHKVLEEYPGSEKVHFGGLPYLRQAIDHDIKRDGLILIPIALVLMLVFLFLVFREWRGVWLPFLVVIMSALLGISMIPILGWKFYIITLLAPILLIAVANDYGIHMIARYQELNAGGKEISMPEMAISITRSLWKPVILTGLTTIAGISALWAHTMIPARQMALVAGVGVLFAIFYSLVLLPAILSLLKRPLKPVLKKSGKGHHFTEKLLYRFSRTVHRRYRWIPLIALVATLGISTGILFLKVDSNEENFFPEHHEVKEASRLINKKFGGSENISVMFSGDMLDPEVLNQMEHYRQLLEKDGAIDLTMSFSGVIREISKALYDPADSLYDRIPPSRDAVAQYMELYSMSGDPGELDQLVDFNYEHANLMIRINDTNNETVNRIIAELKSFASDDPHIACIGGYGYIRAQLANKVLSGTFKSLGIALVLVFILVSLIFRSAAAGLLGLIPLAISVLVQFGFMGLTGIRLDVATALLSSIMIGVGVDYTIHFLWRYREERAQDRPRGEAVATTINTTGRGIVFNALSVIVGFVVLVISSFTPIRNFGVLVVLTIFSCLVGALVVIPALVLRFRFRFLEGIRSPGQSAEKPVWQRAFRRIAVILLILVLALAANGQDAREIIKRGQDAVKVKSFEATSTLTITDAKGNQRIRKNTMASMSLPDGTEKRIIKFLSPSEVRGTGILIFDYPEKSDDMWIYLPALRRTRRIVSKEKSNSFMGSEFTNSNMAAPGLDDFTYSLKDEESLDGHACYVIESVPVSSDLEEEYGYSSSLSWMDKNTYLVYETRYFDVDGEMFKTITNREFKKLDAQGDKYMVTRMEAVNHENGRSSEMVMDQVAVTPVKESLFTVATLEQQ
jgi:hydrophobe/amphiphile efflux-3 (HAE3) family protein